MKKETQEAIRNALRMVVSCQIPTGWRTDQPMPGGGERRSRSRGSNGFDMAARLDYEPGDDTRDIDWAASAQLAMQSTLVTQKYEPRDMQVWALCDVKPTMNFGTVRNITKKLLAAELLASIIKSAEEGSDRVGFMAYSEHKVEGFLNVQSAQRALIPALASLIETEQSAANATSDKPRSGLVTALQRLPRRRSLVFIISDFLELSEDDKKAIRQASVQHDVVCVVVQDRRERELQDGFGFITLRDMRTGKRQSIWLSNKSRKQFAENARIQSQALLTFFRSIHCDSGVFSTEEGVAAIPRIVRLFKGHRG